MSSRVKKWGVVAGMAVLAAAVIFAGGIVGGVVTGVIPVQAQEDGSWPGHGRDWGGPWDILETVAEALGLTPEDLKSEVEGGKTLGEVAEAQGVDTQAIVDAVHAQVTEMVQEAVESGRLTQDQADQILERLEEFDGESLLSLGMPFGSGRGMHGAFGFDTDRGWWSPSGGLDAAAEVLGMETDDLMAELRDGKTLAEIAEEKGVDLQTVKDAMIAQMEQALQEAQEEGSLSPECAECARQQLDECEEEWLEGAQGSFGSGMRGGRHGGSEFFGPGGPAAAE